jgi:CRP/FNR family transcriptional regulator, transcriptional activator FtrB
MSLRSGECEAAPWVAPDDLRRLPLWGGCRGKTIDSLLQNSIRRKFSPREIVVDEGTTAQCLHIVLSGSIELFSRYRRQEAEFVVIEPPHTFVLAAVLTNGPLLTSARVFEQAELLMIPAMAVRKAFSLDEVFARNAATELAYSYRAVMREMKCQTLLTSIERIAKWLIERDAAAGGRRVVRVPIEKRGLAARLGMAPEVFSRGLATLARNEIRVRGADIEIRDPESLRRLAAPQPSPGAPDLEPDDSGLSTSPVALTGPGRGI